MGKHVYAVWTLPKTYLDMSISKLRSLYFSLFLIILYSVTYFNTNSVYTDHSAASDLGLHDFPMSLLWDAKHKCVKIELKCKTTEQKNASLNQPFNSCRENEKIKKKNQIIFCFNFTF